MFAKSIERSAGTEADNFTHGSATELSQNTAQLRRFSLAFIHSHSGATGVFRNAFREFVG